MHAMERKSSAKTSSIGVTRTQVAVQEELGWLFREQPTEDYGVDAHVEVVDGTSVRGRLLGLQIKSGESYHRESRPDGWWFRPDRKHVEYWTRHSLPVIVVLYDPVTKLCHWQLVTPTTLTESSSGNPKLFVPASHVLDASAVEPLRSAAEAEPYELRLRELRLALPWMRRLADGQRLVVDIEEWVNKSSGRGSITPGVDRENGNAPEALAQWGVMLGLSNYAEVVPKLFAWADVRLHQETYDFHDARGGRDEIAFQDEDGWFDVASYQGWRSSFHESGLRPYRSGAGEVDFWRLELDLNALGQAFLEVDRFATTGKRQLVL